jgi:hypothetical protein
MMFRRIVIALKAEYNLEMTVPGRRGHFVAKACNNTRTIVYKVMGLEPKIIDTIRKNGANMSRYIKLGEKRPIRFEEPGNGVLFMEVPKLGRHWEQVTIKSLENRRCVVKGSLKAAFGLGHQDRPVSIDFSKPHNSTLGVLKVLRLWPTL